ncbi:MAG: hypothetical protein CSB19_01835 [Clostridiales bacterium]|nr:MAG: hypothetical protein CSB19_01835 [Clostridiales bacterium]
MKRFIIVLVACLTAFMTSCEKPVDPQEKAWQLIADSAAETAVSFYTWTEDRGAWQWFEQSVSSKVKNAHGIDFNVVKLPYDQVYDLLVEDKANERTVGKIDLLWLNEAEFKELQQKGLLYGPFVKKLYNYQTHYCDDDLNCIYCGDAPTDGFLVPFNVNTLNYFYDKDVVFDRLNSLESLAEFLEANPGKFTYPEPSDPIGGAFVRSVILNFSPIKSFVKEDLDEAQLAELIEPGMSYLQSISKNLYAGGETYPQTAAEMDNLFAEGKTLVTMSYDYMYGDKMSGQSIFPYGTHPLFLMKHNVNKVNYLAIPFNAANKSGAMATINTIIDKELQMEKVYNRDFRGLPAYSANILQSSLRSQLNQIIQKRTVADIGMLMEYSSHDIPEKYHAAIIAAWRDKIQPQQ